MKRLAITALALSLLAGTAATAAPQRYDDRDNGRYEQNRYDDRRDDRREHRADRRDDRRDYRDARRDYRDDRRDHRRWARGQRLDQRYRDNRYYVSDYHRHGLRAPPRGYRWQRVNDQYVMAAIATGLIASVIIANR